MGIFIWGPDNRITDANDAFLRLVGYNRDELLSGSPPPVERRMADLKATGPAQPYEKEYFCKDGDRVPVLVGAATFDGTPDGGVAFVVDVTERKRAERARPASRLERAQLWAHILVVEVARRIFSSARPSI